MKNLFCSFLAFLCVYITKAQETFPVNGVADHREKCYAFTHASIAKDGSAFLQNATMVIRDGKIVSVGTGTAIPKDAVVVDCTGKFIYPSFIDVYTNYGMPVAERTVRAGGFAGFGRAPEQFFSNKKGPFG